MERCSYTDQWLIFLSRNDIRMLILHVENYPYDLFEVHSSLYSCQNLTHPQLLGCAIPLPPPTFKGFLCLRYLVLDHVYMAANTIESLVANSSHLLEELVLESNFLFTFDKENLRLHYNKMRIRAPNLKCFYFRGFYSGICLYAPLLAKLRVFIARDTKFTEEHLRQKSPVCNYTKFLGGFPNLEELSGNIEFMKYLSIGIESCQRSLVFHRLRLIELSEMECDDMALISVFVHLIMGAPNLHKLIISCDCYNIDFESTFACISWDSEFAPNLTFGRLKVIEMSNVYGGIHWMRLIKFLLERSPVLEMMILKPNQSRTDEQLLDMMAQVMRFRRASTNAEILF